MSNPNLPVITLDRQQRQAVRGDIRATAGDLNDLNLAFDRANRDFITRKIVQLQRLVAALDAIGWTEPPDAPDELVITVDADLAAWAAGAAVELEQALPEFQASDRDLDALSGLRALSSAAA